METFRLSYILAGYLIRETEIKAVDLKAAKKKLRRKYRRFGRGHVTSILRA